MKSDKKQTLSFKKEAFFYVTENRKEINFLSIPPYTRMKKLGVMKNKEYKPVIVFHVDSNSIPEISFLEGSDYVTEVLYVTINDKCHIEIILNDNYDVNRLIVFKVTN